MDSKQYKLEVLDKHGQYIKKYEYFHMEAARWMYKALLDCNALDLKIIAEICISFCEEKLETLYTGGE